MPVKVTTPRAVKVMRDPLWETQPGEGAKAYEAFRTYRDLGTNRTMRRAGEILGKSESTLQDWSSRWRWTDRIRAYDAYLGAMLTAEAERQQREAAATWAGRQQVIREQEYALAQGLREKVEEMLKHPITRVRRVRKVVQGGRVVNLITLIEPADWSVGTMAPLLREFSRTSRLSAEMVTEGARAPSPDPSSEGMSDVDAYLLDMVGDAEDAALEAEEEAHAEST